MLAKRIIPCLDVNHGRVVKGTNFLNLRDAGDPVEVAARYDEEGADELVFLDITASHEDRGDPAGRRPPDGRGLLHAADRRRRHPQPRRHPDAAERGGRQGVDQLGGRAATPSWSARPPGGSAASASWSTSTPSASCATAARSGRSTSTAAGCRPGWRRSPGRARSSGLGAGEIVLTSMDADGTQNGYDLEMTRAVVDAVDDPGGGLGGSGQPRAPAPSWPRRGPAPPWPPASSITGSIRSARPRTTWRATACPSGESPPRSPQSRLDRSHAGCASARARSVWRDDACCDLEGIHGCGNESRIESCRDRGPTYGTTSLSSSPRQSAGVPAHGDGRRSHPSRRCPTSPKRTSSSGWS